MHENMRAFIRERWAGLIEKEQWSQAVQVAELEAEFGKKCGRRAVAVHNGTIALELAARVLKRRTGATHAVVPALTVPMVGWAMKRAGLEVVRADVDEDFLLADPPLVLTEKTIVVMVWTAGIITPRAVRLCQMLRKHGIPVLEDASHAHGSVLACVPPPIPANSACYAGAIGNVAAFSMFSTKVWSCGEGGIVVLNDDDEYRWAMQYANAGKARGTHKVEFEAWNCRMTEMQAVLGLASIRFADQILDERVRLACVYRQAGLPSVQDGVAGLSPSWYKYTVRVPNADKVTALMRTVGGRVTQRTHGPDDFPEGVEGFPMTQQLSETHVNLPLQWCTREEAVKTAGVCSAAIVEAAGRVS